MTFAQGTSYTRSNKLGGFFGAPAREFYEKNQPLNLGKLITLSFSISNLDIFLERFSTFQNRTFYPEHILYLFYISHTSPEKLKTMFVENCRFSQILRIFHIFINVIV